MARVSLNTLSNLNTPSAVNSLNENFAALAAALEKTVSRLAEAPDYMEADLDMNNKRLKNLPAPVTNSEPLRKGDIDVLELRTLRDTVLVKAQEATNSSNAALQSAGNATVRALQALDAQVEAALAADRADAAKLVAEAAADFANASLALLQQYADAAAASATSAAASASSVGADAARAETSANNAELDRAEVASNKTATFAARDASIAAKDTAVAAANRAQAEAENVEEFVISANQAANNAGSAAASALDSRNVSTTNRTASESAANRAEAAADQTELDAASALNSKNAAASSAATASNDAATTTANAIQTNSDRVQTGADRAAVAADRADVTNSKNVSQTAATNAAASAASADADATATASDRLQVANDKIIVRQDRDQVALDKTTAANAATTATTAKDTAVAAKDTAVAAATEASSYLGTAKIFQNTTDGLANTSGTGATNRYFTVPSSVNLNYVDLYRNDNNSASLVKTYPAVTYLQQLLEVLTLEGANGYAVDFQDGRGNLAAGILDDGTFEMAAAKIKSFLTLFENSTFAPTTGDYVLELRDFEGNLAFGIKNTGEVFIETGIINTLNNTTSNVTGTASTFLNYAKDYAEINHVICYGQSLSTGQEGKLKSKMQKYDSITFKYPRRYDQARRHELNNDEPPSEYYAAFTPLREYAFRPLTGEFIADVTTVGDSGETQASGLAEIVKDLIASENKLEAAAYPYVILGSSPGAGGYGLDELSKTGSAQYRPYDWVTEDIQNGFNLSNAQGKLYRLQAISMVHGETDQGRIHLNEQTAAQYSAKLETLRLDIENEAKTRTKVLESVPMIMTQMTTRYGQYAEPAGSPGGPNDEYPHVAMEQFKLCRSNPNMYMSCPIYIGTTTDGAHMNGFTYRLFAGHQGIVYKRVVVDGDRDYKFLQPTKVTAQGRVILVEFHVPVAPLKFSNAWVTQIANQGFSVVNSARVPQSISSVSLIGPNVVKIVLSNPIPVGGFVQYAFRGDGGNSDTSGRITGPRGNLCDSQGDTIKFSIEEDNGNIINMAMDNYCPCFELPL